jgi:hypothetical protein
MGKLRAGEAFTLFWEQLQATIDRSVWRQWFTNSVFVSFADGLFLIAAPSPAAADSVNARLISAMQTIFDYVIGNGYRFAYQYLPASDAAPGEPETASDAAPAPRPTAASGSPAKILNTAAPGVHIARELEY